MATIFMQRLTVRQNHTEKTEPLGPQAYGNILKQGVPLMEKVWSNFYSFQYTNNKKRK